jgi:hypothetical protein
MATAFPTRLSSIISDPACAWIAAVVIAAIGMSTVLQPPPANAVSIAAVFPPWWSRNQIWRAALSTGEVVDVGGSRFVLVLHSSAPGLAARLRRAGALLVLDRLTLGVCARAPAEEKS